MVLVNKTYIRITQHLGTWFVMPIFGRKSAFRRGQSTHVTSEIQGSRDVSDQCLLKLLLATTGEFGADSVSGLIPTHDIIIRQFFR